jgi:hypothetical protein
MIWIGRALNLKHRLNVFCDNHNPISGPGVQDDRLTPQDWFVLETLHSSLEVFYTATMTTQGKNDSARLYVSKIDYMLSRIDDVKQKYLDLYAKQPSKAEYKVLTSSRRSFMGQVYEVF